jgi:hypothetical protein
MSSQSQERLTGTGAVHEAKTSLTQAPTPRINEHLDQVRRYLAATTHSTEPDQKSRAPSESAQTASGSAGSTPQDG